MNCLSVSPADDTDSHMCYMYVRLTIEHILNDIKLFYSNLE